MLIVPFVVGMLLRARYEAGLPAFLLPLFGCWLVGYFAFNAVSLLLKAPRARRRALVAPTASYTAVSLACGLAALALTGPALLSWIPAFCVLLLPALVLAARRLERATLAGGLTTAAAALMCVVVACPDPREVLWCTPLARSAVTDSTLLFAYFFGTVLYVKTNIRQRENPRFWWASVSWHALATVGAALLVAGHLAAPAWTALFVLATARAALIPRRQPRLTPRTIGLIEGGFCLAICALVAASG